MVDLSKLIDGKNLTEIESNVLYYIVNNIDNVLKMGVRGIAKENFTSSSTIMRLTKKLGYSGFIDMYYKLVPIVKRAQNIVDVDMQFINSFCSNSLFQYNSYNQMKKFAQKICQAEGKSIFIYGTGFSGMVSEYFTKKLLVLGKPCIFSNGMDSIGIFENNLDNIGILIVVSKSGETKSVVERIKTANENGIFTVSFTNEKKNPVNELADISFRIEDSNKLDDRNMMPNTFFPNVLMLMEVLIYEYHRVMIRTYKNTETT